jgi:putative transposase
MGLHGVPDDIRRDNAAEMFAQASREWIASAGSQISFIAPGSPFENG